LEQPGVVVVQDVGVGRHDLVEGSPRVNALAGVDVALERVEDHALSVIEAAIDLAINAGRRLGCDGGKDLAGEFAAATVVQTLRVAGADG
jgi:hypothetical protein